jgi:hypothetical protein
MNKTALAWFAGVAAMLLIALIVVSGIQGHSAKVETQVTPGHAMTR